MLQGEHSAILSTFIKLPFVIKIFLLSIFEWLFYTGFTVIQHFVFEEEHYGSVRLEIKGSLVKESTEALCLVLIQPRKTGICHNMTE